MIACGGSFFMTRGVSWDGLDGYIKKSNVISTNNCADRDAGDGSGGGCGGSQSCPT